MAVLGPWGGATAFAAAPDLGLQQTFTEPGTTALGSSVALATNKALVGSAGKAIVYTKAHNAWARVAELIPDPAEPTAVADGYGYSVDMTDNIAVVGAPYYSANRGAVYIFTFSSTLNAWVYKQRLTPSAPMAGEKFGVSVSVSGSTIVVGASGEIPPGGTETRAGAAYVFTRASDSDPWIQAERVTGPSSAAGDWFGHVVSLHYDTLVIGAPKVASLSGRAYVYTVAPAGTLTLQKTLEAVPDPQSGGHFGCSVIVRGSTIIVGAPGMNNGAFSFVKSGGDWVAEDQLVWPGWSPSDYYGWGVALCNDTALVAGFQDDPSKTGYAAFFTRSNGEWTYRGDVQLGSGKATGDRFGYAIDLYCTIAAVGAPGDNAGAGTVYFHSTCMPVPIYRFY
ncbi:hypothetical protein EG835_10615, partial [bacterium]|nr:hypothetical protein [bacterium]